MSSTIYVRREVSGLGAGDQTLIAYAAAVKEMQNRPASDPTSWTFQAAIHGTHAANPLPGQNQCQHATWFFVSWHRMFLYYFERIVRAAVIEAGGPEDWALPYWNYELGGAGAAIPPAFRSPSTGGQANPLYVSQRAPGINSGQALPPAATTSTHALSRSVFIGAAEFGGGRTPALFQHFNGPTGQLEATPHNAVHGVVGGRTGWMNDPDQAAQDPIFWLHHANIDRLWVLWARSGRTNTTDAQWAGQSFSFFDEHRQAVSLTATKVLDTVSDLGYTYDQFVSSPPPPTPPAAGGQPPSHAAARMSESLQRDPELVGGLAEPVRLSGSTQQVQLEFNQRAVSSALASSSTGTPRVLLEIQDIDAEEQPGTVYAVYVNLPPNTSADDEQAHHVGTLSFFGVRRARNPSGDQQAHGLSLTYDITELANRERAGGQWNDKTIIVTFEPLTLIPPDGEEPSAPDEAEPPATIGSMSVYYA